LRRTGNADDFLALAGMSRMSIRGLSTSLQLEGSVVVERLFEGRFE
jgi:hypothetical protein